MKPKPIIFSGESVRAILDGRKTMTRRVVKPQPNNDGLITATTNHGEPSLINVHGKGLAPYQPGDVLWVRETFVQYRNPPQNVFYYKADNKHLELEELGIKFKWHSSRYMPFSAARIFLRVTDVRAERLCQITSDDCRAEGVTGDTPIKDYHNLWNRLNAKRGYSWESNPWVWVYEFERTEAPK